MISTKTLNFSNLNNPTQGLAEWEDFVAGMKNGHVFQTIPWAAYREKVGWRPILLSYSNGGSLQAGCMILQRSIAGLPFSGILHVPRGPVLDYDSPDAPRLLSEVLDKLVRLARRRFAVVRVCPDVKRTTNKKYRWVEEMLLEKGFHRARRPVGHTATFRLDLTQPLKSIMAGMSKDRRRDIRKFEDEREAWSYDRDGSLASLEILYGMYRRTIESAGKSPKSFQDLRLMHETLASYGASFILVVKYNDRPVSAVMVVPMKNHFWGFGASMDEDAREFKYASIAMYWEIIKWAKSLGYTTFDLQGIPEPSPDRDDPLYGVYRFKQKWGGEEVHLVGEYDYTMVPFLVRLLEWKLG